MCISVNEQEVTRMIRNLQPTVRLLRDDPALTRPSCSREQHLDVMHSSDGILISVRLLLILKTVVLIKKI